MSQNPKKPICVLSTDWHIKRNNHLLISKLIDEQIAYAKSMGINYHLMLGDAFDTRAAQPLTNLLFFGHLLDKFETAGHTVFMIPGNHDKVNQKVNESYMGVYSEHKALHLYESSSSIGLVNGITMHFLPFFEESTYKSLLEDIAIYNGEKNVLLTHIAFNGSTNNDGSSIENKISLKLFSKFDKVFAGHYHNMQSLTKRIHHIPSLYAGNFGEDNDKGLTVLYDDLSTEVVVLGFPKYKTLKVDIDVLNRKQLLFLVDKHSKSQDFVRFHLIGSRERIDTFDYTLLKNAGIAYKVDRTVELQDVEEDGVVIKGDNIIELYEVYAEKQAASVKANTISILKEVFHG